MASISVGPHFFKKEFNDYQDWRWAVVREFLQNSIDCSSSKISVTVDEQGDDTILTVENNGSPMTEDILVNKLLALGESGKNFDGSVGGFGKAKIVLYFAHEEYTIRTGSLEVKGRGGDYSLERGLDDFVGTRSQIRISGLHSEGLCRSVRRFARFAQWPGVLSLNGESLKCGQNKGTRRRDLGFGVVFTNKSDSNLIVVRIGGIPMFVQSTGFDRLVIVELTGRSDEILTSNRDGLVHPYSSELSSFITELSVDKRSALKPREPHYERFIGEKIGHSVRADVDELVGSVVSGGSSDECESVATKSSQVKARNIHDSSVGELRRSQIASDFVLKNETGLAIPDYYCPDSREFSTYSKKLTRTWGRLLLELHRLFERSDAFSVGFVFDEECEAQFEQHSDFGKIYYINPARVVTQSSSSSKSFKKRFKLTERDRLLSIAVHEFLHGAGSYWGWHDENYANALTDMFAIVMSERKRFNWCFR